jgi:predicted RNase H-like nuclease (RuvC/YqgF family)
MYYVELIIGFVGMVIGGGGIWLFTIKSTREKARAEAMKEVQDVYQETITDLREDKRFLKEDVDLLKTERDKLVREIEAWKKRHDSIEMTIYQIKKDVEA